MPLTPWLKWTHQSMLGGGGVRRRHSFGLANHLLNTSLLTVPPGNTRLAAMTSTPTATITVA
jgi:hypothetical protein